mgnify:CR=1 FL=1
MSERNEEHLHQVALFRYGLIAELLHIKPGSGELYQEIRKKAARKHAIPGTTRGRDFEDPGDARRRAAQHRGAVPARRQRSTVRAPCTSKRLM